MPRRSIPYNKLVRSKTEDTCMADGWGVELHTVSQKEMVHYLKAKLLEEAGEFLIDEWRTELCDLLEVVFVLGSHRYGYTEQEMLNAMHSKREVKGGLYAGQVLTAVWPLEDGEDG